MRPRISVYLDTSVISALFDSRNPERMSLTEDFFRGIGNYEVFVSEITVTEIERTPDLALRASMKKAVAEFTVLSLTGEAIRLAQGYIQHGAVPGTSADDAYHIALAVVNNVGFILSWNFKHIVRRKTRDIVTMVNTLNGYGPVEIITPAELS